MNRMFSLLLTIMMGISIASAAAAVYAFNEDDLNRLRTTNECIGCDLSGADLRNADMKSAKLSAADLKRANLAGADLSHANLMDATLTDATMTGTDLSFATWTDGSTCQEGSIGHCNKETVYGVKQSGFMY